jgi:mediator of RNA polymerase II transcription subunit 12
MLLFDPRIKRDALPEGDSKADEARVEDEAGFTWEDYASERNLGDGLTGEPMSARLITSNLYAGSDEATVESELVPAHSPLAPFEAAGSPATSVSAASLSTRPRRMSTRLASHAGASGIKQPTGSNRDPIPVDEEDDSDDDISDGDLDIVEAPAAKRPRTSGKTMMTTGGKAPARKTMGGKTVGRKATKGVRSTGGKVPAKGARRKSGQD